MQFKRDALLLRSADWGESDKMITLLTAEGKLSAGMKGVRKSGARLKFAAQPFCFAEYVFASRGARNTVTAASLHDGFYSLREDIRAFYAGACVLETCDRLSYEGMESGELLVAAVGTLGKLSGGGGSGALVAFLLRALAFAGYAVRAGDCPVCGQRLGGEQLYFDMESGAFCCGGCAAGVRASGSTYRAVCAALGRGESDEDGNLRALRLLGTYFTRRTEYDLPSLHEYTRLLRSE